MNLRAYTNPTGHIVVSKKLEHSPKATLALDGTTGFYLAHIQAEEGSRSLKLIKR